MSFRISKSLKHVPLPIVGHTLAHIANDYLITLVFASPGGLQSQLRFWFEVILSWPDGNSEVLVATRPGPTFDREVAYEALSPLLEKVVAVAFAHADGRLEINFDEGTTIQVHPDNYEAWHFQQPAPGSLKPPHYPRGISLTGYGGGLI
ncbi:MAG: DUF6188 family protein [Chloroflexia bacterium]